MGIVQQLNKTFGHKFIAGMTRSGKTFLAICLMKDWRGPVLFFNPQEEDTGSGFIEAGRYSSVKAFRRALKTGQKINYIPGPSQEGAERELKSLIDFLRVEWSGKNLLLVADECQDFARQGDLKSPLLFVARRGLARGINSLFLAQSPADVSKVVVRQSRYHVIFETTVYDSKYFNDHKLPGDLITQKLRKGGKHSFCVWDNMALNGPYKV
jgi:hypothetical protein